MGTGHPRETSSFRDVDYQTEQILGVSDTAQPLGFSNITVELKNVVDSG